MKKFTFIFTMLFSVSGLSQSLEVKNPGEFEYVHCVIQKDKVKQVVHYVIDIRDENAHKLYRGQGVPQAKASDLKNLALWDSRLIQNSVDSVDVSWVSSVKSLSFALNILDNGGQVLQGTLTSAGRVVQLMCRDAALEK